MGMAIISQGDQTQAIDTQTEAEFILHFVF
jgi:hypothetical protein